MAEACNQPINKHHIIDRSQSWTARNWIIGCDLGDTQIRIFQRGIKGGYQITPKCEVNEILFLKTILGLKGSFHIQFYVNILVFDFQKYIK